MVTEWPRSCSPTAASTTSRSAPPIPRSGWMKRILFGAAVFAADFDAGRGEAMAEYVRCRRGAASVSLTRHTGDTKLAPAAPAALPAGLQTRTCDIPLSRTHEEHPPPRYGRTLLVTVRARRPPLAAVAEHPLRHRTPGPARVRPARRLDRRLDTQAPDPRCPPRGAGAPATAADPRRKGALGLGDARVADPGAESAAKDRERQGEGEGDGRRGGGGGGATEEGGLHPLQRGRRALGRGAGEGGGEQRGRFGPPPPVLRGSTDAARPPPSRPRRGPPCRSRSGSTGCSPRASRSRTWRRCGRSSTGCTGTVATRRRTRDCWRTGGSTSLPDRAQSWPTGARRGATRTCLSGPRSGSSGRSPSS